MVTQWYAVFEEDLFLTMHFLFECCSSKVKKIS